LQRKEVKGKTNEYEEELRKAKAKHTNQMRIESGEKIIIIITYI